MGAKGEADEDAGDPKPREELLTHQEAAIDSQQSGQSNAADSRSRAAADPVL